MNIDKKRRKRGIINVADKKLFQLSKNKTSMDMIIHLVYHGTVTKYVNCYVKIYININIRA